MLGLARFAMRNVVSAATVAAVLLLLSILSLVALGGFGSFISFMAAIGSAAIVALAVLRNGLQEGAKAAAAGLVMIGGVALLIGIPPTQLFMMVLMIWLPTALGASILRSTAQIGPALLGIAAVTAAGVVLTFVMLGDPEAFWLELLQNWLDSMLKLLAENGAPGLDAEQVKDYQRFVELMATVMTGAIAASLLWVSSLALLLARSWQARLYNPGGFQPEFHALTLGRKAAMAAMAICAAALVTGAPLLTSLATLAIAVFLFQGIAVVHSLVKSRGMGRGWLIGVYAMLLLIQTTILLGALGMVDNWLGLRKK